MEGIEVEDCDEMDLNSTTYSEFAKDLAGDKDVFASSFLSTRDDDLMNSIKEEPDFSTTPIQHSQCLTQISQVSSVFDGIAGLPNDKDLGLNFSNSTWVRELCEGESLEDTFTSREESFQPVSEEISRRFGNRKSVKMGKGSKRKICEIFSEILEDKENGNGVTEGKEMAAPASSLHNQINLQKSTDTPQQLVLCKKSKPTEETSKQNPKRRKIISKEKTVKLLFSCKVGSKSFSRKKQLNGLQRMHQKESSSDPCVLCGKTFRLMCQRNTHKYTHMSWDQLQQTKRFHAKCYFCNDQRIFFNYGNYEKHFNTHSQEKPHSCRTCSKRFADPSALKQHELVHSKEKRFKCNKCGKRFTHLSNLKAHDLVHMDKSTREKTKKSWKHECEFCQMKFRTPSLLERHRVTHTGEKPFSCSLCNQTFTRKWSMSKHKNTQH